jgi:abelson tyrosine-protein kinase 1
MRPPFSKIVQDMKILRVRAGGSSVSVDQDDMGEASPKFVQLDLDMAIRESPDIGPVSLPPLSSSGGETVGGSTREFCLSRFRELCVNLIIFLSNVVIQSPVSRGSSVDSYRTLVLDEIRSGSPPSSKLYTPEGHVQKHTAKPQISMTSDGKSDEGGALEHSGYDSPPPTNERIAEMRNERRYRMLLSHDFHPSCKHSLSMKMDYGFDGWFVVTLPLWTPSPVSIGAVGYLSKPSGTFVTLFDAFDPIHSSGGIVNVMPSLYGYGNVARGSHRQGRRNMAQKGLEFVSGLLTLGKNDGPVSYVVFRFLPGHRKTDAMWCVGMIGKA